MKGKSRNVENYLRAANFEHPDWIPCRVGIMPATWRKYREKLEEVILRHPKLFPNFERGQTDFDAVWNKLYQEGEFTDNWGCTWRNIAEGLDSVVVGHPLEDWDDLATYQAPDPLTQGDMWENPPDWEEMRKNFEQIRENGGLAVGGLMHGFMYMRLFYLRGFENLMIDIAMDEPKLQELIEMVLEFNMALVEKFVEIGAEYMIFADDLGLQDRLPISPEKFRKYLKPCYKKMFGYCRERGVGVYFHSDGHILEIIPDLIECGVTIINPQFRANTLEGLEKVAKGRVCIDLDLDRQLFPFAKPEQIRAHILEAVERLYMPEGGLMLYAECEPDVPLENIEAICQTLEEVGGPAY